MVHHSLSKTFTMDNIPDRKARGSKNSIGLWLGKAIFTTTSPLSATVSSDQTSHMSTVLENIIIQNGIILKI